MRNKTRSLIGVVTFIISVYIVFRLLAFPAGLFSATFIGGLVVWMLTTYRVSVDPGVIVVPHLVTVILFIVHVYEEFVAHIEVVMTRLTGVQVSQANILDRRGFHCANHLDRRPGHGPEAVGIRIFLGECLLLWDDVWRADPLHLPGHSGRAVSLYGGNVHCVIALPCRLVHVRPRVAQRQGGETTVEIGRVIAPRRTPRPSTSRRYGRESNDSHDTGNRIEVSRGDRRGALAVARASF